MMFVPRDQEIAIHVASVQQDSLRLMKQRFEQAFHSSQIKLDELVSLRKEARFFSQSRFLNRGVMAVMLSGYRPFSGRRHLI